MVFFPAGLRSVIMSAPLDVLTPIFLSSVTCISPGLPELSCFIIALTTVTTLFAMVVEDFGQVEKALISRSSCEAGLLKSKIPSNLVSLRE